ncbi:Homeobox-leucine zipper protein HDG2, partial [Striga hermonthica]
FFKECPHPDERQRADLSLELGMEPMQVKFWFQNKRTQIKTQHEHKENTLLRTENEKLRAENMRYREVLSNASCPTCGGPTPIRETSFHEQQLRNENARLREEIDQISSMSKYVPNAVGNFRSTLIASNLRRTNPNQIEGSKTVMVELVTAAMEELMRIAQLGEPLWVPTMDRNTTLSLNEQEYLRSFSRVFGPKPNGFKSEASRETVVVAMSSAKVIEILMDVEQWSNVFSAVVSRGINLQVISPGVGGSYNEAIHMINAEFQVPSPLVPTRESYFVRYCRQDVEGTWVVADVSLDQLLQPPIPFVSCRRRPSGCLVQQMPNEHSKVTWVEHVEVKERSGESIYKPLITAGLAYGAKRWVAILDAHSQRAAKAAEIPPPHLNCLELGSRKGMLIIAERMVTRFCRGVNASNGNSWSTLSGNANDAVRVLSRKNVDDPTMPFGIHLSVATSLWLPVPPKIVFDFLRDHQNRKQWDILSNGGEFKEVMQIGTGNELGNCISVYQVKGGSGEVTMLQESRMDPTASYVVYAPIEKMVDPSSMPLLPSGFAILPDGPTVGRHSSSQPAHSGGSLLTISLQVLLNSAPNAKLSMVSFSVAGKLISSTVDKIKHALLPKSSQAAVKSPPSCPSQFAEKIQPSFASPQPRPVALPFAKEPFLWRPQQLLPSSFVSQRPSSSPHDHLIRELLATASLWPIVEQSSI